MVAKNLGNGVSSDDLMITIDCVPGTMSQKVETGTSDIISTILKELGYSGSWRLNSVNRMQHKSRIANFTARSIQETRTGDLGIKIITKCDRRRNSCFEGILIPPTGIDPTEVCRMLKNRPTSRKTNGKPKPVQNVNISKGEIFVGKVDRVNSDGVFISIVIGDGKKHDAFCPITKICNRMLDHPNDELSVGQTVRIQCDGAKASGKPTWDRSILLSHDQFNKTPLHGVLGMNDFTKCEERLLIAVDIICSLIELYSTKDAWEEFNKSKEKSTFGNVKIGGIFLEGKDYPFAPSTTVREALKLELAIPWKAKSVKATAGLIRVLVDRGFIYRVFADGETAAIKFAKPLGYCVMEEGYEFVGRTCPNLPPYYDPPEPPEPKNVPSIPTPQPAKFNLGQSLTGSDSDEDLDENFDESPDEDCTDELLALLEQEEQPMIPLPLPLPLPPHSEISNLPNFDLVEQYEVRKERLLILNDQLQGLEPLVQERDEITAWMEVHPDAPEQARKADKLEEQVLARRARLNRSGE